MGRNRESRTGIAVLAFIVASATAQFNSPADVRGDCADKTDGIYPMEHCSPYFLECSGGITTKQNCAAGLWFNPQSSQCDYRDSIVACQDPFTCEGQKDGRYGEGCSSKFWFCSGGELKHSSCPTGTFYNVDTSDCDYRDNIRACGNAPNSDAVPTTRSPRLTTVAALTGSPRTTTTEQPRLTVRESTEVPYGQTYPTYAPRQRISGTVSKTPLAESTAGTGCAGKEDGAHATEDCSGNYVLCWAGTGEVMKCPQGLMFNEVTSQCDYPLNVAGCSASPSVSPSVYGGAAPVASAVPSTASLPIPRQPMDFDCSSRSDGLYSRGCVSEFYQCSSGLAYRQKCPQGLVFDDFTKGCDYPSICSDPHSTSALDSVSSAYSRAPTTVIPAAAAAVAFDCSSRVDGLYSEGCVSDYFQCASGLVFRSRCQDGLVFDGISQRCEFPHSCGQPRPLEQDTPVYQQPQSALSSDYTASTLPQTTPIAFDCSIRSDGRYGDACSGSFIQCVSGMAYTQKCPEGLVFHQKTANCEYPEKCSKQEDAVEVTVVAAPTTQPMKPTLSPADIDCLNRADGMYSSGCSRTFVQCFNGMAFNQLCPEGLVFVQESGRCDYPDKCGVPSEETVSAAPSAPSTSSAPYKPSLDKKNPTPTTTSTPKRDQPAGVVIDCTTLSDGMYTSGCTHAFVQCSNGNAYPLECPAGLVFDKRVDQCVWPEACSSEVAPSLPTVTLPTRPSDVPSTVYDMKEEKEEMVTDAPLPVMSNDGSVCTGTGRRELGKCSSGFVQCIGGKLVARRCPGQSLFDQKIGLCVYDLEGCEMDVDVEQVTDQETTVPATGAPQQDDSTGYNRQPVQTAPSYTEQTNQQTGYQQTPQYPQQQQYYQSGYQTQYSSQYPTQSQPGYPTDYQAAPVPVYQSGYQPSAQDPHYQNGYQSSAQEYQNGYQSSAQEYQNGYQPSDQGYHSGYQSSDQYQSVPQYPVYSSFGDSSLPSPPLSPECEIGSFRRVSACSASFDACSPTARQWIRRLCGKSHRFDSSANRCRPIFEVRECDEPMSSYVPPPVQSEAPAIYAQPASSLDYGVPVSGRDYEDKHVVDPFKGGYQSGRMGSNPFVAIGNSGTFYTDDGSRWVGSAWSEGGERRRGGGRRRHHKHGHDSGDYVIVSGNPFGAGRDDRVLSDEWKGRKGRDGHVRSSLTAAKGKRVKNVVDHFKGRVSHYAPPLGAVNPFAVKRADGHRRRGRKSCRRDKHRRREDWDEDCEEKKEKNDEDEDERPIQIEEDENEKTESVEESADIDERPADSEAIEKEFEDDGEKIEEAETNPELMPEAIDSDATEKTEEAEVAEEVNEVEEKEEETEKIDDGKEELEESDDAEETEEATTMNGPVEEEDDKVEGAKNEEDEDENSDETPVDEEKESGSIEGEETSDGENVEERTESETGDAVEELNEDDVEKEFEDGETESEAESKTDVETPEVLDTEEKTEVNEEEEETEKTADDEETMEEPEEMEKEMEETEDVPADNGDNGETPVDEEAKAEEETQEDVDDEIVEGEEEGEVKEEETPETVETMDQSENEEVKDVERPESIEEAIDIEGNGEEKEETPVTVERPEDTVDEKIEEEPELNEPEDEEEETKEEAVDDAETAESIEEPEDSEETAENGEEKEDTETDPELMPEAIDGEQTEKTDEANGVNEEEKEEETEKIDGEEELEESDKTGEMNTMNEPVEEEDDTIEEGKNEEQDEANEETPVDEEKEGGSIDGENVEERTESETGSAAEELNEDDVEKEFEDGETESAADPKTDVETPEALENEEKNEGMEGDGEGIEMRFDEDGKQTEKGETPEESAVDDSETVDGEEGGVKEDEEEEMDDENEEVKEERPESLGGEENEETDGHQSTQHKRRRRSVMYDSSVSTQSTVTRRLSLPRSTRLHRSRFSRLCVSSTLGQTISIGQCRQDFVYCKSARRPVVAACPVGDLFDAVMATCVPTEICGAEMAKSVTASSAPTSSSYLREGERPTMPVPTTTTHQPEQTPVAVDADCSSLSDGAYPLSDCSSDYFVCSASIKHIYQCPAHLVYHKQSDSCEWPASVPACNGGAAANPTSVPATDTTETGYTGHSVSRDALATTVSPMHVHFDCLKDGGFAIDCKGGFAMCSNGQASFMKCSPGLIFEESSQSCQYPAHVSACGLVPVATLDGPSSTAPVYTSVTPSTTAVPARAVEVLVTTPVDKDTCLGVSSGLEGATRVCPSSFVICDRGQVTAVLNCPEGTFFDEKTKKCDYREVVCAGGWNGEAHGVENHVEKDVPTVSPVTESEEYGRRSSRPYRPSLPVAVEKMEKKEEVRDEVMVEEKPVVAPSTVEPVKGATCDWKGVAPSGVCSSQFIICSNGRPEAFGCSSGLVFSPSTSACEYPEFVSGCPQFKETAPSSPYAPSLPSPSPVSTASPISTAPPVSTASPVSDAVVVDESASEYPRDDNPSTTTMMPFGIKTGEHTSAKFEATGDHCTFVADQPSFPLNYCSMTYAVCTAQGMAYRTNCTFGYLFDSVLRHCVPSEHCGQPYIKDIAGASPSSLSLHSLNGWSSDSRCVGVKDGTLKATSICSGQYIRCEKESVVLQTCAGVGRVFSPLTGRCVQQVQMAECSSSPRGLTPPITRPKALTPYAPSVDASSSALLPTDLPSPPSHRGSRIRGGLPVPSPTRFDARSFCTTKHSDGLYRNPENCAGIVQCFGGEAFSYPSCAEGLFFNEVDSQCDYASNVPDCASQADPVAVDDSSASCKGQPHGAHLADDSNCSIYYRCVWGSLERLACPDGTVFNPRLSVCDYPSEVPHCQKQ